MVARGAGTGRQQRLPLRAKRQRIGREDLLGATARAVFELRNRIEYWRRRCLAAERRAP
jgi:hypothetical protein